MSGVLMEDNKLASDEARREAQHDSIKSRVENDVNADIAARADRAGRPEAERLEQVAKEFRAKAVDEVVHTEREVERSRTAARVSQVIDYLFYIFYAPFRGIVASPSAEGHTLALPIVVALIVYVLLHLGINRLLRLLAHRKTQ